MSRKTSELLLSAMACVVLLCGCGHEENNRTTPTVVQEIGTEFCEAPTLETTVPLHSELYLSQCSLEELLLYFEEVVLHMEYTDGTGNPGLVQKWMAPMHYRMYGSPSDADLEVLNGLFKQLNSISGFPGIFPAEDGGPENVRIYFQDPGEFREMFSEAINHEDAFGAAQFWYYTASNELHTAQIGYRTDIDQSIRNSVLAEEIINILGISDTVLRQDSIVYQYSDDNRVLSEVDLLILKLLYHPMIQCGMDAEACAAVIRELYF